MNTIKSFSGLVLFGTIGVLLRHGFKMAFTALSPSISTSFPIATLSVNLTGSFLAGALYSYLEKNQIQSESIRIFLFTGFLGGFTTFSALTLEVIQIVNQEKYLLGLSYSLGSLIFGIGLAYFGYKIIA